MVLCGRCAEIDFGSLIERVCIEAAEEPANSGFFAYSPITKDFSFAVLRSAAIQGCDLCSLIHQGLLDSTSKRSEPEQLTDDGTIAMSIMLVHCHPDFAPVRAQCRAIQVDYSNEGVRTYEAWIGLNLATEGNSQYVSGQRLP